ncbi:MAG: 50S ribosomal protein L25/general stress protein Ctc [Hyphomicrobiales bacterium]
MTAVKQIKAEARAQSGKGAARAVRRAGRTPAVIYGAGAPATSISLDSKEIGTRIRAGRFLTTILEVDVGGKSERVIPRDFQLDPVKDFPIHVDFMRLAAGQTIRVEVPVHFINHEASPGLKRGGTLNIVRHTIELFSLPESIPEYLTADLTGLDINDGIHISAIALPEGVRPAIRERDFTVATVAAPTVLVEAEPTAAAAAEGATPEGAAAAPAEGAAAAAAPAAPAAPAAKKS